MTCLDTTPLPARRSAQIPAAPLIAALALLLGMGVPALMAPPSALDPLEWHGNAAPSQLTRR